MKRVYVAAAVSVFLIGGVSAYFYNKQNKQYDLVEPKIGPINEAIYGIGTVMSKEKFTFKVAVPKTIKSLYVHEGQRVQKGQKILQFNEGNVVNSPLDGTVSNLPYHDGENVFTERPVVEIENLSHLYVEAQLDQQSSMRVKIGDPVRLSFETLENKFFKGKVESLYHSNGQFIARIEGVDLPKEILPGMTSDVAVEVAQKASALLVPVRAVQMGTVLIEREGKRQKVNVKLGIMDQEWAEVISDTIKPGDKILLKKAL